MKKVAFLFTQPPHGNSVGREGLDTILSVSTFIDDIAVFFIGDGVFHLLKHQEPKHILARDYISTFKVLALYDVDRCFASLESFNERGLATNNLLIDVTLLSPQTIAVQLHDFDTILTF